MNLVDSSGWIEYLLDTPRAELFAGAIEQRERLLVPVIALYEVHRVLSRKIPTERPKAGQSRPSPVGIKQSGKATFA